MSKPKQHHVVPRIYLENFVDKDDRLTIWSKRRRKELRPKPEKALTRFHYYSQPVDGIPNSDHTIESVLFQGIEDRFQQFLDSVRLGHEIDVELAVQTISTMQVRSPAFREAFEIGLADMVNAYRASMPESKIPKPPVGFEDAWEKLVVTIDPHRSLAAMAYFLQNYGMVLAQMAFSLKRAPRNKSFLTSDNPVVWYHTGYRHSLPTIYPQRISRKTRAIFPLSKSEVLVGKPSLDFSISQGSAEISRRQLNEFNEVILASAWDNVVGKIEVSKRAFEKLSRIYPRIDIGSYDPESGAFVILDTYLGPPVKKWKYRY